MVASMADLAAAMWMTLCWFLSPSNSGEEGGWRGRGGVCERRSPDLEWRRGARPAVVVGEEGNGEWEEKGNQKSVGLDLGLRTLCVHMSSWVDSSSAVL